MLNITFFISVLDFTVGDLFLRNNSCNLLLSLSVNYFPIKQFIEDGKQFLPTSQLIDLSFLLFPRQIQSCLLKLVWQQRFSFKVVIFFNTYECLQEETGIYAPEHTDISYLVLTESAIPFSLNFILICL